MKVKSSEMKGFGSQIKRSAFISGVAEYLGCGILLIALLQLLMTLFIRVGASSDPTEVYLRNFSSIVALLLLGYFLIIWGFVHLSKSHLVNRIRMYKIVLLAMSIASMFKTGISICYVFKYLAAGNLVLLYYLGETLVWGCLTAFFALYYLRLRKKWNIGTKE